MEIKVWGRDKSRLWTPNGSVEIPPGYGEVPIGNPFLTRYIKSHAETYYLRMEKSARYGSKPASIIAPIEVVRDAIAADASSGIARKQTVAKAHSRERNKVKKRILELYPRMPQDDIAEVLDRAFEVGSQRVGRSTTLDLDTRIRLAVQAHIRHVYTDYDLLLSDSPDYDYRQSKRDEVRSEVRRDVLDLIKKWEEEA